MVKQGIHKEVILTISTGNSLTTACHIGGYECVVLELPTFVAGCNGANGSVVIQGGYSSDDTFRQVFDFNSAASGLAIWQVQSAAGNYCAVCSAAANFDWIKIQLVSIEATDATYAPRVHMFS